MSEQDRGDPAPPTRIAGFGTFIMSHTPSTSSLSPLRPMEDYWRPDHGCCATSQRRSEYVSSFLFRPARTRRDTPKMKKLRDARRGHYL